MTAFRRSGIAEARSPKSRGGWWRSASVTATGVLPANGRRPVTIS